MLVLKLCFGTIKRSSIKYFERNILAIKFELFSQICYKSLTKCSLRYSSHENKKLQANCNVVMKNILEQFRHFTVCIGFCCKINTGRALIQTMAHSCMLFLNNDIIAIFVVQMNTKSVQRQWVNVNLKMTFMDLLFALDKT